MAKKVSELVFDLKMLNICAWLTLLVTYITPYRISENGFKLYGYPFAFYKVHPLDVSRVPLWIGSLDLLVFLIDLYLIYLLMKILNKVYGKIRREKELL